MQSFREYIYIPIDPKTGYKYPEAAASTEEEAARNMTYVDPYPDEVENDKIRKRVKFMKAFLAYNYEIQDSDAIKFEPEADLPLSRVKHIMYNGVRIGEAVSKIDEKDKMSFTFKVMFMPAVLTDGKEFENLFELKMWLAAHIPVFFFELKMWLAAQIPVLLKG